MTLPQPTEVRLLPRSPYCLSSEGESRLVVASYFVWAPFYEAWRPTSARVLRSLAPVETTHPHGARATGGPAFYRSRPPMPIAAELRGRGAGRWRLGGGSLAGPNGRAVSRGGTGRWRLGGGSPGGSNGRVVGRAGAGRTPRTGREGIAQLARVTHGRPADFRHSRCRPQLETVTRGDMSTGAFSAFGAPAAFGTPGVSGPGRGHGPRRRLPAPLPGGRRVRLCPGVGRGAACRGPARSPAWRGLGP
jgi:hypothetical protein